ncbi:hypothetical protein CVPH_0625 [Abyssogena phaseoliformis symbiont OG214]|uniref:hypothetical protein n=1 Tax=Abyssogena phaseoliformis symbiont TaxID=596095 RepID=UPI001914FF59|nr:hypothetical protein [Abyssogena phaseoliformis symbiont]BBB22669.1 hypothetical protein CVPH_0625 [Abyssogena phaseoliformis symbiont OG214]
MGVEIEFSPSTRFEFGTENSNTAECTSYARLTTALPFKDNEKFTNFITDNRAFKISSTIDLTTLVSVERTNKIRIEKVSNGTGNVVLGEYNSTTDGASCTLKDSTGLSKVATTGADIGSFSLTNARVAAGLVTLSCTGGEYTDEATSVVINPAPSIRAAAIYSRTGVVQILASPLSEVAYQLAGGTAITPSISAPSLTSEIKAKN